MRILTLWLLLALVAPPASAQEEERGVWVEGWVRLQLQFDDGSLGTRSRTSPRPSVDGITRFPAEDEFSIRRFQTQLIAHLNQDLEFQLQGIYQERQDAIDLQRFAFRHALGESRAVALGFVKVPFDYEQIRSNSELNVIERSDVTRALAQNRDTGLAFDGEEPWGEWAFGVYQGQGEFLKDENGGKDVIGRIVFHLGDTVQFGGYGHLGTYRDAVSGPNFPVRRAGTEFRFHQGPFRIESEYLWSEGYNFFSQADTSARGFYVDLVLEASEWLDLVAHYDRFDPDLDRVDRRVPDNAENARSRTVFGANFYLDRQSRHRIVVDYELHSELEGPVRNNDGFRVQYQIQADF